MAWPPYESDTVMAQGDDQFTQQARQPFNVNAVAQAAALGALSDNSLEYRGTERNRDGLEQLTQGLDSLKVLYPQPCKLYSSKPGMEGLFWN